MTNGPTFDERYLERVRHELALELAHLRRTRQLYRRLDGDRFDSHWYQGAIDAITDLAHINFARPDR